MSKTLFIEYGEDGFWAYDVAVGVFLKHLIDQANKHVEHNHTTWLRECISKWRVNAVISDFGLHLDPSWTQEQRQIVRSLIDDACREMEKSQTISAEEASSWKILDGQGVFARGTTHILTAPVIELSGAIGALLDGVLPKSPPGTWWCYGDNDGRSTLGKRG